MERQRGRSSGISAPRSLRDERPQRLFDRIDGERPSRARTARVVAGLTRRRIFGRQRALLGTVMSMRQLDSVLSRNFKDGGASEMSSIGINGCGKSASGGGQPSGRKSG